MSDQYAGIYLAVVLQAIFSTGAFLKVRNFALNVLLATVLTTGSMAAFLLLFNQDPFDHIAIVVVFAGSLLVGSPVAWLALSAVSKMRGSRKG